MPSIKDHLNKLKQVVIGTKTSNIDNQLDALSKDISSIRSQNSRASQIELIKTLISKSDFKMPQMSGGISGGAITPGMIGQASRLARYNMFESITTFIPYCNRALNVITDNIISPDDITKTSLEIKPKTKIVEENPTAETDVEVVKNLLEKIRLEKYIYHIIKNTLQSGDFFCEIADSKQTLVSKGAMLVEASLDESYVHISQDINGKDILSSTYEKNGTVNDCNIELDYRARTSESTESLKELNLEDINLLFYDPKRVVKLQSDMYPICFGYLVFPSPAINPQSMMQDMVVNNICATILGSLERKIPELQVKNINDTDLKDTLRTMIKETDPSKIMEIRYVPPEKMVHFHMPSKKYYPYGESIYDCVTFPAKCLIALETALTMHRLNRSIERRKIAFEIGLPRDAAKQIERMKEEITKRKIALDSFGSLDTIPSMISSMETLFLPMKDGKELVQISGWNDAGSDIRGKTDELKLLRDTVVAGLNVPPSYIGIDENISNKNALTSESYIFARSIVLNQKIFSEQFQELVKKIFDIIDPEKSLTILDNVLIAFPVPRTIQDENESKQIGDAVNIIQQLETVGVPREWSKKRYLPNIPWEEVEQYEIDDKIETKLKLPSPSEIASMSGGLGQFGGMGGSPELGGIGSLGGYGGIGGNELEPTEAQIPPTEIRRK